jgi:hypothetical protein
VRTMYHALAAATSNWLLVSSKVPSTSWAGGEYDGTAFQLRSNGEGMSKERSPHEDLRIRYLRAPPRLRHQDMNDVDLPLSRGKADIVRWAR